MSDEQTIDAAPQRSALRDPQRRGRLVVGGLSLLLAAGYLWQATGMPGGAIANAGPGLWPTVVGWAWVAISIIVIVEAAVSAQVGGEIDVPAGAERRRVLWFAGATIALVALMPILGTYVAAALYSIVMIKTLGDEVRWWRAVVFGIVLGAGTALIFIQLLQVRLPRGVILGWL